MARSTRLDELFEPASPLAQRLSTEGPFDSDAALVARARDLLGRLSEAEKVGTLNAHPRIGEQAERMSSRTRAEQGSDSVPELEPLNQEYEDRFGFRFVVFVNRRPRAEIAKVLRERLGNTREQEMRAGLDAIVDIAEDRIWS